MVQVEGGGVALSSLRPQYHACASVYSGWIAMALIHNIIRRRTQLLTVFCKYSRTLWVVRPEPYHQGSASGAPPAGDNPRQQSLSPPCRGSIGTSRTQSQSSFPPQFLLNHSRDNPHYESRCGKPERSENPTQSVENHNIILHGRRRAHWLSNIFQM